MRRALAATLLALLPVSAAWPMAGRAAEPPATTLVACAPGYPGTTAEAQPSMDAFAAALARTAGWPPARLSATYLPTEKEGQSRLAATGAAVALVPLPFLLQHRASLRLSPRLAVEQKGLGPAEAWTLVAKKGRVHVPADLAGFTVVSIAGYAPGFVRGVLGPAWRLPESVKVVESGQVLSALRKAVQGEDVALLLDGAQGAALPGLPFHSELDLLARSEPLPAAVVATVGTRLPAARWAELEKGLRALPADPAGAAALDAIRMVNFAPVDTKAIDAVARRTGSGP
jgi:hypothetical protein